MFNTRSVIVTLSILLAGCSSSGAINTLDDFKRVTDRTYGQITVTDNDKLYSSEALDIIAVIKSEHTKESSFHTLNDGISALDRESYPADDILLGTLQQGRDLVINNSENSLKIIKDSVVFTFVNEKMFKTGSRVINSPSISDLKRVMDALKSNSGYYLHVRTYDAFNPYDYNRTANAKAITESQIEALKKFMKQLSPSEFNRVTFEAMGNSHILALGSSTKIGKSAPGKRIIGSKEFLPINSLHSVRVDFIFSKKKYADLIVSYCENRDDGWYSAQCQRVTL
ncbi:hypothetical protein UA32_12465 [Photobacterium angustum]|uniref:Uncharacterized protein n=1 Tax=Photobacterium angustum TaxID=661 RepID=A0ABX5H119_PHOAN|nr:hypothetical protein [Photobacterium angustum]KJG37760.1 hypothetical protein UA32_12465 [Photobacterium angustum]PSX07027.1 hypothetical protein C0W27_15780 [Photobacterium angustum]